MGQPGAMEEMGEQLKSLFGQIGAGQKKTRKLKIGEALKLLTDEEAKLINEEETRSAALSKAQEMGIVFIDEIDKVASRQEHGVPRSRAKACSATCCPWSKARR